MFDTLRCLLRRLLTGSSFQDALRSFFPPIKTDYARVDFYTMYRREAIEYDTEYIKKYDEDLNTTLIFVRRSSLFSSSISFFLIGGSFLCRQLCFRH